MIILFVTNFSYFVGQSLIKDVFSEMTHFCL